MLLDEYSSRNFIKKSGKLDMTTNVELITQKMYDVYDIKLNNEFQIFGGNNALFPFDFFCAKDLMDGKIKCTENTYAIHHFKASWVPWYGKLRHQVKLLLVQLLGREFVLYLKKYQKKK